MPEAPSDIEENMKMKPCIAYTSELEKSVKPVVVAASSVATSTSAVVAFARRSAG
jgi:hypothetical protein